MTNFFFGLKLFLIICFISWNVSFSKSFGYAITDNFIIASHPAEAKNKSVILFSSPTFLLSRWFFDMAYAPKHFNHIST